MKVNHCPLTWLLAFFLPLILLAIGCNAISSTSNTSKSIPNQTSSSLSPDYLKTYPTSYNPATKLLTPPPANLWNYSIQTSSRVYFADKVIETPDNCTMIGFWSTEGDHWVFGNRELVLVYKYYGKVQITQNPGRSNSATIDGWKIDLISSSWSGSTLTVNLKITNLGQRRNFGILDGTGLAVIDSTNKRVNPLLSRGQTQPSYAKEYYPNEDWAGKLTFQVSPYSGETDLYFGKYNFTQQTILFRLGTPQQ